MHKIKVLIVDDKAVVRQVLSAALAADPAIGQGILRRSPSVEIEVLKLKFPARPVNAREDS